jgi:hypothetical protein
MKRSINDIIPNHCLQEPVRRKEIYSLLGLVVNIWEKICSAEFHCYGFAIYYILFQVSTDFRTFFNHLLFKTADKDCIYKKGRELIIHLNPHKFLLYISTYDLHDFLPYSIVFLTEALNYPYTMAKKIDVLRGRISGLNEQVNPYGIVKQAYEKLIIQCYTEASSHNASKILISLKSQLPDSVSVKRYRNYASYGMAFGAIDTNNKENLGKLLEYFLGNDSNTGLSRDKTRSYFHDFIVRVVQNHNFDLFKWIIGFLRHHEIVIRLPYRTGFKNAFKYASLEIMSYCWQNAKIKSSLLTSIQNDQILIGFFENYNSNSLLCLKMVLNCIKRFVGNDIFATGPFDCPRFIKRCVYMLIPYDNLDAYSILLDFHIQIISAYNCLGDYELTIFVERCITHKAIKIFRSFGTNFSPGYKYKFSDVYRDISPKTILWIVENRDIINDIPDFIHEKAKEFSGPHLCHSE